MNSFTTSLKLLEVDNLQVKKRNAQSFAYSKWVCSKRGSFSSWKKNLRYVFICIYSILMHAYHLIYKKQGSEWQTLSAYLEMTKPFTSTWRSFNISAVPSPWWTSKSQINTRSTSSSWKHQQPPEKTATTPNLNISSLSTSFNYKLRCFHHIKRAGKCNNSIDFSCRNFPEQLLVFHVGNPAGFPQLVTFGDTSTKRSFRRTFAVMAKSWIPRRWGPKVDSKEAQWKGETFGNTSGNISLCMYRDTNRYEQIKNTYIRYPKKRIKTSITGISTESSFQMHSFMNFLEWRFKPMQLSVARGLVHHQQIEKWERVDAQNTWPHLYSICKYRLYMLIYVPIPNGSTWKLGLSTIHKMIFCSILDYT